MRVWISADMEGVAGVVDEEQCRVGAPGYQLGCALMQGEVNAAIEGAVAGGATEVVVNDSHGRMANLDPRSLAGSARYLSGRHKPLYMAEGLDTGTAVALLVGYHGMISGPASVISHTYDPAVITRAAIDGVEVGEAGINALVLAHHRVPIGLVAGDEPTWEQSSPFAPDAEHVVTKRSITRAAALNLHPAESCARIRDAAERAATRAADGALRPPPIERPTRLDLDVATADMAEVATWCRGVERTGERAVRIAGDDLLAVYRAFVAVTTITRRAGGR